MSPGFFIEKSDNLFKGFKDIEISWMSHGDSLTKLSQKLFSLCFSIKTKQVSAFKHFEKSIYGVQFHPEVSHSGRLIEIYKTFAFDICSFQEGIKWSPETFIQGIGFEINEKFKNKRMIVGISGGVDSMTMIACLRKFIEKDNLTAVYVDSGLMKDETKNEVVNFCISQDIKLIVANSSDYFFSLLNEAVDPVEKGKIIGKAYIDIFEKYARDEKSLFLCQGTIWSDVVESGITKFSSVIKPHHNVGGLPKDMTLKLYEPFRNLYKDQVRKIAKYLNLDDAIINKKVFPGPGFAIRVDGVVNKEKVDIVRGCTRVIEEIIENSNITKDIWMAFAILIEVDSLGVRGDERVNNKYAVVVRIVESTNSMSANFSRKAYPFLETISHRLIHECGIGRVVYDITDKPPATIEWQ